jgi:DNA (cytosine-5)-methyltransferase 1
LAHPALIEPTRDRLIPTGLPYVIENVMRARRELREPVVLCATSLGLGLDEAGKRFVLARHRVFETNWWLMVPPCACDRRSSKASVEVLGVYGGGTRQDTRLLKNTKGGNTNRANVRQARLLMDMPWANRREMNLAIPPAYTEWIGRQLLAAL